MEYTKINPKPMINEELTYIDEIPNTAVGFTLEIIVNFKLKQKKVPFINITIILISNST